MTDGAPSVRHAQAKFIAAHDGSPCKGDAQMQRKLLPISTPAREAVVNHVRGPNERESVLLISRAESAGWPSMPEALTWPKT